jgi:hypothetical protein
MLWFLAQHIRFPRRVRMRLAPVADSYNAPAWFMCWLGWHGVTRISRDEIRVCVCGARFPETKIHRQPNP